MVFFKDMFLTPPFFGKSGAGGGLRRVSVTVTFCILLVFYCKYVHLPTRVFYGMRDHHWILDRRCGEQLMVVDTLTSELVPETVMLAGAVAGLLDHAKSLCIDCPVYCSNAIPKPCLQWSSALAGNGT